MSTVLTESPALKIALSPDAAGVFDAGVPVLAGEAVESLFGPARPAGRVGEVALFQAGDWLLGAATLHLTTELEEASRQLYRNIFEATRGRHLARIWNYIPALNEAGPDGLENYRGFCRGRSLAFEQHHGSGFKALLPSASAVGTPSAALTVAFAACDVPPRHVENPLQVAAYDYPGEYGPRAPSFARATVVSELESATVFISGTAAIRGHATVASWSTPLQLECTLENLHALSRACGLGAGLATGKGSTRHFKVYVRYAADLPLVTAMLEEKLFLPGDHVSYLLADICRTDLRVEVEASFFGVTGLR